MDAASIIAVIEEIDMSNIIFLIGSGIGMLALGILFLRWFVVPLMKAEGVFRFFYTPATGAQLEREFKIGIWSWIAGILIVIAIALTVMANSIYG